MAVDAVIVIVLTLLVLLYVFLLLGEIWSAIIAFAIALTISLGARLAFESRHKKTESPTAKETAEL